MFGTPGRRTVAGKCWWVLPSTSTYCTKYLLVRSKNASRVSDESILIAQHISLSYPSKTLSRSDIEPTDEGLEEPIVVRPSFDVRGLK